MKARDDKGGENRLPNRRPNRDDTPSIIRDVERLTSIPTRNSIPNLPVLEMPRSQRIWRRIRIPLFVAIVIALLLTVAVITHDIKVASSIAGIIDEALALEVKGTIEQTRLAETMLNKLKEKYSGDDSAAAAWAWQTALQTILFGEVLTEEAKENLSDVDDSLNKPYAFAARAGHLYLSGKPKEALAIVEEGLKLFSDDPRISLVQIVSMNSLGQKEDAWNRLLAVMETHKDYLPLIAVGGVMALENGDRLDALELSKTLLTVSPGNLYAEMLIIRLGLPAWGESAIETKQLQVLQEKFHTISPRMGAAPPKLKTMGHYLRGRLLLAAGKAGDAIAAFKRALVARNDSEFLAWYAKAVRINSNVTDALSLLDKYKNLSEPPVLDIKAQLLLEYYRVRQARKVIEQLHKSGALPHRLKELSWMLAIRSGDIAAAKKTMPEKISGNQKWPALEMYFLLKRVADTEGIDALVKTLDGEWGTCSRVIRSWHSRSLRRAVRLFDNAKHMSCAQHLMPRLMRERLPAEIVAEAAEDAYQKSDGNLVFAVDRALAVWRVKGHAEGVKLLDQIASLKPEGEPVLGDLAAAYLEMDLPDKAVALLGKRDTPELLALRIQALELAKKKKETAKLIKIAVTRSQKTPHPVYTYFKLRKLWDNRDVEAIKSWSEENLSEKAFGEWTSEIVELVARAFIALDEKEEAGDIMQRASKHLLSLAGADEAIDMWAVDVKLNVNRGGRYKNRAMVIIRTLRDEGVRDPTFSYWLGVDNITNGSERLGLKFIKEALSLDPGYKPAWAKMAEMEWIGEQTAARMRYILPDFNPPGAPPPG